MIGLSLIEYHTTLWGASSDRSDWSYVGLLNLNEACHPQSLHVPCCLFMYLRLRLLPITDLVYFGKNRPAEQVLWKTVNKNYPSSKWRETTSDTIPQKNVLYAQRRFCNIFHQVILSKFQQPIVSHPKDKIFEYKALKQVALMTRSGAKPDYCKWGEGERHVRRFRES